MKTVAVTVFKAQCLALLETVARTGETLIVTKRGKPLARVVPSAANDARSPQDTLAGSVTIVGDVLAPVLPASAWDAARGEILAAKPRARRRQR